MRLGNRALLGGLAVLAGACLHVAFAGAVTDGALDSAHDVALLGFGSASLFAGLAVAAGALQTRPLDRALALGRGRLPWGGTLVAIAGILGVSQLADLGIDASGLRGESVLDELARALDGARGPALASALVGIALAPGVAEELLFRGALQGALLRVRALPPAAAVALAALAFGAAHLDPVQSAATVPLGLYLGALACVTGSVRAPIAAHVLNNAVAALSTSFGVAPFPSPWLALAASLAVAAPGVAVLARHAAGRRS
jgi:membrane protease YdiL (CAAX protease family)